MTSNATLNQPTSLHENSTRTTYAICGLSLRGIYHFALPLMGQGVDGGPDLSAGAEIVAILDVDRNRPTRFAEQTGWSGNIYTPESFDAMMAESRPDCVIITGPDHTHADYAVRAVEAGADVILEKPMATNCDEVNAILAAEKRTGRSVRVALNYRYSPLNRQLKKMILEGAVGRITNIEFVYNLDTRHGASYFFRWNRMRQNSGGLSIHKCCHHFDLVNWWVDDDPVEVFAFGARNYYGPDGAQRPKSADGLPLDPIQEKENCPYFRKHYADKLSAEETSMRPFPDKFGLTYDVQYPPDRRRYIYDPEIDIEDTYSVNVRYSRGAMLSYSFNASTPWEGYVLGINGTEGRIEVSQHSNPDPTGLTVVNTAGKIVLFPLFGGKQVIDVPAVKGSHGGADHAIQQDLFDGPIPDSIPLQLAATSRDGALSVAVGEAVWRSATERRLIQLRDLLPADFSWR